MPIKKSSSPHVHEGKEHEVSTNTCKKEKECCGESMSSCCGKTSPFQAFVIVVLLIVTAMSFINYNAIYSSLDEAESAKVGGSENYAVLQNIMKSEKRKEQYKQQFDLMEKQFSGTTGSAVEEKPAQEQAAQPEQNKRVYNTITPEQISAVVQGYTYGSNDAPIVIIEYSDLECPFCKRHHDAGTIKQAMEKFSGKVKYIFKHFPLNFHQNAQKGGEAAECLGEQLGNDQFYAFLEKAYAKNASAKNDLLAIGTEMGAHEPTMSACIDEGKFAQKVKDQMSQGQSIFQVSGTPGNVVLNTKTGKWTLISGAYPVSEFEAVINEMLAE